MSINAREILSKATCLHSLAEIDSALDKMAFEMKERLADKNPILLCLVLGGIIPFGNLLPRLDFPLEIDYIHVTRYGNNFSGNSALSWKATPTLDLTGRTVVIIDDILDEGISLAATIKYCKEHGASDVLTAVMLDKKKPRAEGGILKADFVGIEIEDKFVFGYGLDYHSFLRNAPGIYVANID